MRKLLLLSVALIGALGFSPLPQQRIRVEGACNYDGKDWEETQIYAFASDRAAEQALQRVMYYTGLPPNFVIVAANVPNAAAVIEGDQRFILYNQYFMERVGGTVQTDWAALSILAHEIGHHLSGHTLTAGGSRPESELEADKFSGFVLQRMGSSLDEARAAIASLASDRGSRTHPPKSARLAAITNGWKAAEEQAPTSAARTLPPRTPVREPARTTVRAADVWESGYDFPDVKDRWDTGYRINRVAYGEGQWQVVLGLKEAEYGGQAYRKRTAFPKDDIAEFWDEKYEISELTYANGQWLVVMTKFGSQRAQLWRTRTYFPEEEIEEGWDDGYRITHITYGNGVWALVMSETEADYQAQKWHRRVYFPEAEIKENWDEGYRITELGYSNGVWVLVMTKFKEGSAEIWRTRSHFSEIEKEIVEKSREGYRVTSLSYGDGMWALVMTR